VRSNPLSDKDFQRMPHLRRNLLSRKCHGWAGREMTRRTGRPPKKSSQDILTYA